MRQSQENCSAAQTGEMGAVNHAFLFECMPDIEALHIFNEKFPAPITTLR